ncbi:MAG: ABC transporter permease [Saprospiraceae bacterium]|nr:ABC transporter permease [Saprospiraceae bacterium]
MGKIFKYTFYDLVRNRWMIFYTSFFLMLTSALLLISPDLAKVAISLSNITVILTPLVGILFGVMYYYGSTDYIQFLLAQPISRRSIFAGMYTGMAASLSGSLILGIGLPMIPYGILTSPALGTLLIVLFMAVTLSIIFSLLAFLIAMRAKNKIRGFGIAIFSWLFFALIYDGIFLLLLLLFKDYPIENLTLGLISFNPIDLARILTLLKLDMSAMMGYTGAVLQKFFGTSQGSIIIVSILFLWVLVPYLLIMRMAHKKDF